MRHRINFRQQLMKIPITQLLLIKPTYFSQHQVTVNYLTQLILIPTYYQYRRQYLIIKCIIIGVLELIVTDQLVLIQFLGVGQKLSALRIVLYDKKEVYGVIVKDLRHGGVYFGDLLVVLFDSVAGLRDLWADVVQLFQVWDLLFQLSPELLVKTGWH